MSRQIQIRRGTADEHTTFTGAIGEVTYDTTNKTLRVHDGTTVGGTALAKQSEIPEQYVMPSNYDFVVDVQLPTAANNYTWYRKYKSGWVEQGGIYNGGQDFCAITLPIEMSDANYCINGVSDNNSGIAGSFTMIDGGTQTKNGFTIIVNFSGGQPASNKIRWYVCGVSAS